MMTPLTGSLKLRKENLLDVPQDIVQDLLTKEFVLYPERKKGIEDLDFDGLVHIFNQVGRVYWFDDTIFIQLADSRVYIATIESQNLFI